MPRQRQPLDPKYGKLTVISDPIDGLKVFVRCECGAEKWVLRSNLTSHRISSCGGATCKVRVSRSTAQPFNAKQLVNLRLPPWLPKQTARALYEQLKGGAKPMFVATHYGVHVQTIYNWIKVVRQSGGIERYLQAINGELVAIQQVAGNPEAVVADKPVLAEPGVLPTAPPRFYQP